MQFFLPYPDVKASLDCLDPVRWRKQKLELMQIYRAATEHRAPWAKHCVVRSWRGHKAALKLCVRYMIEADYVAEMESIGCHRPPLCLHTRKNSQGWCVASYYTPHQLGETRLDVLPEWFGDPRVHSAYRSHLLAKDGKFYRQYGWDEEAQPGYMANNKDMVLSWYSRPGTKNGTPIE